MIRTKVICDCIDIPLEPGEKSLQFEVCLKNNATLEDVIQACQHILPLTYDELLEGRIFVRDHIMISMDTPICDGDRILLLKAMAGG